VIPLFGGGVVVRGGGVRRGGRFTVVVARLGDEDVAPPPVAEPEVVPPPPISCWAVATPADKKKTAAKANRANNRLVIGSAPCAKLIDSNSLGKFEIITPQSQAVVLSEKS
jgi:hypothetical protein